MLNPEEAKIRPYRVIPLLPDELHPLLDIARNLWWTWNPDAVALFQRLDPERWRTQGHNPVKLLGHVSQQRLESAARDESFRNEIERVYSRLDQHISGHGWFANRHPDTRDATIAYFCAEFGLTECFQIYSGGLGILAGDHLKSASELGVPLVGIGLLYQHGYFNQNLNADGWQLETYPDLDFANQPIQRARDSKGDWIKINIEMPGRTVCTAVWKCQVGRVPLYLLDTNVPENKPADRQITRNLYGGDVEMRIQQEIILGIGGMRALDALDIHPTVCHINEGHAAFLSLERIRRLITDHHLSFNEALTQHSAGTIFTTHTPVPAGIDRFHPTLIDRYFGEFVHQLSLDLEGLKALGRENVSDKNEFFSMAVLAIRTSDYCNGVSRLHGEVSRKMWRQIWPGVPEEEVPIAHVTNGIHARSWLPSDVSALFDRYLGYRWQNDPADYAVWNRISEIPDEELWAVHTRRRARLVTWARQRIRKQCEAYGRSHDETETACGALDPEALTIGFARRFATYKRATLLLRDKQRLEKLLNDPDRPIQILIAGKSHPADSAGKELIREIVHFSQRPGRSGRVVFIENYDMDVARHLVTGCDVWLNTPCRGLEASGTSGMKAAVNGVINCSILDGWWDEGYSPDSGFAIGRRDNNLGPDEDIDAVESESLYNLLEEHIIPEFYNRDGFGVPHTWITRMKKCIQALGPVFNSNRMVHEYTDLFYVNAHKRTTSLRADEFAGTRALAADIEIYRHAWPSLKVESVLAETLRPVPVRTPLPIQAVVQLGSLSPDQISVQVYAGSVAAQGNIVDGMSLDMQHVEDLGNGRHRFTAQITAEQSGRRGFAVRIIPRHPSMVSPIVPGLITWDSAAGPPSTATPNEQPENAATA